MLRILTLNVHGWTTTDGRPNVELVADLLARSGADVIGLNEIYHPAPSPGGAALAWVAERLGFAYVFAACQARLFPGTTLRVNYGNALLSRRPLGSVASGFLAPRPDNERRGWLTVQVEGLTVVVTHLDHLDEQQRLDELADLFAGVAVTPDVIVGDFNAVHPRDYAGRPEVQARLANHPVAAHLNPPGGPRVFGLMEGRGYADALMGLGHLGVGTFIPAEEPVRLDYLWVAASRQAAVRAGGIVEEPAGAEASDHRAVYADLAVE